MSRCWTSTRFAEFCMSCFRVSTWRNQKERKKIGFLITHKCFIGLVLWVIYLLTREPIREEKTTFASAASSTFNCFSSLVSGFKVVSHSCAGIISPNPKEKMWRGNVLILNHEAFKQDNRIHNWNLFQETQNSRIYWWSYLWTSECYMTHLQEMYSGGFWVLHHRSNSVPAFPSQPENSDQWENGTDTQPQKKKSLFKKKLLWGNQTLYRGGTPTYIQPSSNKALCKQKQQLFRKLYSKEVTCTKKIIHLVSKEKGQQQCSNMSTIDISICKNYDFMITEGVLLEIFPLTQQES